MKQETRSYSLRMPLELKERLDNLSKNLSKPKPSIVREALEAYLNEIEDFSFAVNVLEGLKDGDYSKASKKIDKVMEDLQKESDDLGDFGFVIEVLEELKDGDYSKASKKIDKIVKNLKKPE